MRNVTLAIEEEVLRKARIRAAKEGTTVNAVIRKHLAEYGSREERIQAGLEQVLEAAAKYKGRLPKKRWTRDEIHVRNPKRGW